MLFAKSALVLSFLALGNIAAAASTKACLLSAVGQEPHPGDLKAVCITDGEKVQSRIASLCGDDKQAALKQFADICSSAGHKTAGNTLTSSGASSTGTSTAGSKSNSSGFVTASPTSTPGSHSSAGVIPTPGSSSGSVISPSSSSGISPSSSSSGIVPLHTANAGSSDRHIPAAAFAAVVFVGFAATL
ncbi:hypothetical protein BDV28DRAFT_137087 [Aspergillus coremiiformis]|uniref:GPI anchored cell wall protein n=1 Tax=Aspergillus coremiiformis TaxID=138285 RepID=A0A5N6Z175_9EURO|nr:hypothetical protein BDV28DRAFT_137087 [Aspergillus coremiiformis]